MTKTIISVKNLVKNYGNFQAVKGISFDVYEGEIFGLLGPNGAGKSTTLEIIETLREKTGGEVTVDGIDLDRNPNEIKKIIGVQLQSSGYYPGLNLLQLVDLFCGLYNRDVSAMELLEAVNLKDKARAQFKNLSGGQKQRFSVATTLINQPKIIFLDEPTTGLDPQVRLEIRDLIEELRAEKRTILLTTHYIEEAERLCDRVAIIDNGVIIAIGSPRELQEKSATQSSIEISLGQPLPPGELPAWPHAFRTVVSDDRRHFSVSSSRPPKTLVELIKWVDAQGFELEDVHLNRPTLEDVFIELTGKRLRD